MSTAIATLNSSSIDWLALVVAVLWQSTLLAVVVALVALTLRGSSPAVRYWLWQIVAIKLLLMPVWSWTVSVPWPTATAERTPETIAPTSDSTFPPVVEAPESPPESAAAFAPPASDTERSSTSSLRDLTWQSWLLVGWAAIVALLIARLAWQRGRLVGLLRRSTAADEPLRSLVDEIARTMSLKRSPVVLLAKVDCSPFVCGVLHPRLVLPVGLAALLAPRELRPIVAHELAHVKRRDLVWGWTPQIARIVYFFHPVAHWAAWRVRLERELACDQLAMSAGGHSPGEYAQTLVRVVSHVSQPDALKAAIASLTGGRQSGAETHK